MCGQEIPARFFYQAHARSHSILQVQIFDLHDIYADQREARLPALISKMRNNHCFSAGTAFSSFMDRRSFL